MTSFLAGLAVGAMVFGPWLYWWGLCDGRAETRLRLSRPVRRRA